MNFESEINKKNLILITIVSVSLRLFFLFFYEGLNTEFIEDSRVYFYNAKYVEKNGLLSWKFHANPPLISLIIIPLIKIFPENITVISIKILMILISVLTCIALYFLTFEISKSNKISLITSACIAIYPFSIFISNRLLTENPASLFICLISIFFIKFFKKKNFKFLFFASFLLGLLSLTRSSYFYLPFFLILVIFFINMNIFRKVLSVLILLLTFFTTLSPWIINNYIQLNEIVPTTTRLGKGLWISNNDFSSEIIKRGGYEKTKKHNIVYENSKSLHPVERSKYLTKKAMKEIFNNKSQFFKSCIYRFINFFHPKPNPYTKYNPRDIVMILFYSPFLIIFFISIINQKYELNKILLLSIIFYAVISHLPFYGIPRFRLPVDSLIFLLSINYLYNKKIIN